MSGPRRRGPQAPTPQTEPVRVTADACTSTVLVCAAPTDPAVIDGLIQTLDDEQPGDRIAGINTARGRSWDRG